MCTPHPACSCVPGTKPNKSIAQLGWNEYLVWAASFCAWVPEPRVCPVLITVTPLPRCLPQLRWEWTKDIETISDFKHCSYQTLSPRFVSQLTSKACTLLAGSLTAVWHMQEICFSSTRLSKKKWGVVHTAVRIVCGPRGLRRTPGSSARLSRLQALRSRGEFGSVLSGILSCATSPDEKESFARGVYCTFLVARGRLGPGSCLLAFPLITAGWEPDLAWRDKRSLRWRSTMEQS